MANSIEGTGADEILEAIGDHAIHLEESGSFMVRQKQRTMMEIQNRLEILIGSTAENALKGDLGEAILSEVLKRDVSPAEAAKVLASSILNS